MVIAAAENVLVSMVGPTPTEVELAYSLNHNRHLAKRAQNLISELHNFKDRVRTEAISVREEMDWCMPGLNEHLRNLGLDEFHETYSGRAVISFDFRVENADSLDTAECWARDVFSRACRDFTPSDGDVELIDSDVIDMDVDADE